MLCSKLHFQKVSAAEEARQREAEGKDEGREQVASLSRPLGHADSSFRALSGRLKFTVRRHKFNKTLSQL